MPDLDKTYLFRITHIDNVPHILERGITHSTSANANALFVPIGDSSLIATRNNFLLNNGKRLGDYIPFYFAVRTPMLYVIQNGFNLVAPTPSEDIVYCVSSVKKIIDCALNFVFTDGHAVDSFTTQYQAADVSNLASLLDWVAIRSKYWRSDTDLDLKRRKEAEFLVLGDIPSTAIGGFIVSSPNAKNRLIAFGVQAEKIHINAEYFF